MELLYFFIFFSKINRDNLNDSISAILQASQDKPRKFTQSVELQIVLKNYDPQKDRRFAGTVRYLYMLKWQQISKIFQFIIKTLVKMNLRSWNSATLSFSFQF